MSIIASLFPPRQEVDIFLISRKKGSGDFEKVSLWL
jgi:hypothetical protein